MRNMIPLTIALVLALGAAGCGPDVPDRKTEGLALAGVPGLSAANIVGDTSVLVRRVYEGPTLGWGSTPSPDGRYLTVVGDAGSLGRLDLVTGEILSVKDKGTWSEAAEWAETSVFSPDGNQIASVYGTSQGYEIRISGVDGSNEQTLIGAEDDWYAMLYTWQRDEILGYFFRQGAPGPEIVGISPGDGAVRIIKTFSASWREEFVETPLAVSRDGRFFSVGLRSPQGDADVAILRTTDGTEVDRIEGPANDLAAVWTPDGGALLFHSDRQMTEGIWRVEMDGGRPVGEPELVRGDLWQSSPIGASLDAYFFQLKTDMPRVRMASFDPESGALISDPTAVSEVAADPTRFPIWSPDGRAMAYVKKGPEDYSGMDQSILVVRSLSGPDAREIPLHGKSLRELKAWTSDGEVTGIGKSAEDGDWYVWSIDLESGQVETLLGENDLGGALPRAVSPDGRTVYYNKDGVVSAMDLASRQERAVVGPLSEFVPGPYYVSPDGETLALILSDANRENTVLAVVPTAGGSLRELFRQNGPDGISVSVGVFWPPTGEQLFFSTDGVPDTGEPERLWKADYSGPEPVVVELQGAEGLKGATEIAIHPDGSRIAFVSGEVKSEVWMMTNLSGGGR